ncbi:uncharacterized protein LOC106174184 isoform X1 [Lingula anatina]|uniref:Uncharacterized protein LOC106174184 isoform X1 n=2 Tax=Lingula anatina TaxID=7574 RepID=A0A1S3JKW6_LINAN|nr:uncharacterized protein LOC106174184 isoform X1 [Lingula anatina]XP_013411061.1 uncharacterized protein LOC106174184 isoform X1 [Lingula anatina]|eukprot:XP_013411060.1 uncharacterized protein LOC106174184 isoform X1 [Lingula anatina]
MEKKHRDKIDRNMVALEKDLDPRPLYAYFIEHDSIRWSEDIVERIEAKSIRSDKVWEFLGHVKRSGPKAFETLVNALHREGPKHLANLLDDRENFTDVMERESPMFQMTTPVQTTEMQQSAEQSLSNGGIQSSNNNWGSQFNNRGSQSSELLYPNLEQGEGQMAGVQRSSPSAGIRGLMASATSLGDEDTLSIGSASGDGANWSSTFEKLIDLGFEYASVFDVMKAYPDKSAEFYSLKLLEAHQKTLQQFKENSQSKAMTPADDEMSKRLREMGFTRKLIKRYIQKYPGETCEFYIDKLTKHQLPRSFSGSSDESGPFLRPSDSGTGTQSPASSISSIPETPSSTLSNQRPVSDLSLEVFQNTDHPAANEDAYNTLQSVTNEDEPYKFPSSDPPNMDIETTDLDLEETLTPTPDNASQTFVKFPGDTKGEDISIDQSGIQLVSNFSQGGDSGIVDNLESGSTIPSENAKLNLNGGVSELPSNGGGENSTTVTSSSLTPATEPKVEEEDSVPIFSDVENIYYFEYKHLQKITENFAPKNCIATDEECGFGGVFTGVYPYDGPLKGKDLAVKRLKLGSKQGDLEYNREKDFAQINYVYLLTPLGVCEVCEDGYQKCLVYILMPGSDLKKKLKSRELMNWKIRLRISAQLANAVLFLQEDGSNRIYHRDIKSANVFLDSQLNARLGDLGFARPYKRNYTSDISQSKTRFSLGYQDPDYLSHGTPTEKTDCYGLGVVFLELLTNVTALEEDDKRRRIHEKWDREGFLKPTKIKGKLSKIMDKRLEWPVDVAQEYAQIIANCLRKDPDDRFTVQEVSERLMKLYKAKLPRSSLYDAGPCRDDKIQARHCLYCLVQDVAITPMTCGCRFLCDVCLRQRVEVNKQVVCVKHEMDVKPIGGDKEGNIKHQMTALFTKNEDNSETISLLRKIMEYSKYVGILVGPCGVTGSCFQLGKEFIMTNLHVLEMIFLNVGNDVRVLGDKTQTKVSFQFEDLYSQHSTEWLGLEPDIVWSNKELDVAILKLKNEVVLDSAPRWGVAATTDYVHIIGHNNGDIKKLDYRCPLKSLDDSETKEILTNGKIAFGPAAYEGVENQNLQLLQTSFMHGASGSPCFDKFGRLVLLFTRGYPNLPLSSMSQLGRTVIEQGVKMECICETLAAEKEDLAHALFDFGSGDNSMEVD